MNAWGLKKIYLFPCVLSRAQPGTLRTGNFFFVASTSTNQRFAVHMMHNFNTKLFFDKGNNQKSVRLELFSMDAVDISKVSSHESLIAVVF